MAHCRHFRCLNHVIVQLSKNPNFKQSGCLELLQNNLAISQSSNRLREWGIAWCDGEAIVPSKIWWAELRLIFAGSNTELSVHHFLSHQCRLWGYISIWFSLLWNLNFVSSHISVSDLFAEGPWRETVHTYSAYRQGYLSLTGLSKHFWTYQEISERSTTWLAVSMILCQPDADILAPRSAQPQSPSARVLPKVPPRQKMSWRCRKRGTSGRASWIALRWCSNS